VRLQAAVAFPGQGIQSPGMAAQVKGTRAWKLFTEASTILGYDLGKLCLEGPDELLNKAAQAQAAIYVTCMALWELHGRSFPEVKVFLGHSLGELAALTAAGALDFTQGVQLVEKRGELMSAVNDGGMLVVSGLRAGVVRQLCAQVLQGCVEVAAENTPGQVVVSGDEQGLLALAALAKGRGAKRVTPLKVTGPFHSQFMRPAAEQFAAVVAALELKTCTHPVLGSDGQTLLQEPEEIKRELVRQLTEPVRFMNALRTLEALGIEEFVEVSPVSVLIPLAKRAARNFKFTLASNGGM